MEPRWCLVRAKERAEGYEERLGSQELALALYERKVLSLGKAQELAQMTRWEFDELLG